MRAVVKSCSFVLLQFQADFFFFLIFFFLVKGSTRPGKSSSVIIASVSFFNFSYSVCSIPASFSAWLVPRGEVVVVLV